VSVADFFLNEALLPLARDPETLLVFPHAQRTGGRTIRKQVWVPIFGEEAVYYFKYLLKRGIEDKDWGELTDADLEGYRALTKIFNYSEIPLRRPYVFMAMVRHPVHRALSYYHYVRRRTQHPQCGLANQESPEGFIRKGSLIEPKYHSNVQCMRICGQPHARTALDVIRRRYAGVGLTHALPSFVEAFGGELGWPYVPLKPVEAEEERYKAEATAEYTKAVLAINSEDIVLYNAVAGGTL
jgi:hypothetical protein